jgi:hypothetical protein
MDCKKADKAMLQYADKTIQPAAASALAKHVLVCEDCREMFLAFDEAMEESAGRPAPASPGFTESVMARVKTLPPYVKVPAVSIPDIAIRIFWGLCAVFLGFGLLGMSNPEGVAALLDNHPRFSALAAAFGAAGQALDWMVHQFLHTGSQIGAIATAVFPGMALSALFFVAVVGALLAVLMRADKISA